ncbi:MAG: hypothetical protein ACYC5K_04440 [Saccharofermentanales bacterium]
MMIDDNVEVQKLKVTAVIREAAQLYKANCKLFLTISFIAFLISIVVAIINYFRSALRISNYGVAMLLELLLPVILLIATYYSTKFSVALYAGISERLNDREADVKRVLSIASEKVWRYIWVGLQLFLMLLVPFVLAATAYVLVKNMVIKYLLISVAALIGAFFYTIYGFAPFMAIFEKDKVKNFVLSRKMVKGDFHRTAFLMVVIPGIFLAPGLLFTYVFNDKTTWTPLIQLIASSISNMVQIFVVPFTSSLGVVLYYKLMIIKDIGDENNRRKKSFMNRMIDSEIYTSKSGSKSGKSRSKSKRR